MKLLIKKGVTSKVVEIAVKDSSSTTGAFKTGVTAAMLSCTYSREDDGNVGATTVALATGTRGAWGAGGNIILKDDAGAPGDLLFSIPNTALATGAGWVTFTFKDAGSNNIATTKLEIQLVDFDPQDSVRLGLSALPNASAAANGGLPTVDANNNIHGVQPGTGTGQINVSGGVVPANLVQVDGSANATHATGMVPADVRDFGGVAGTFSGGMPAVHDSSGAAFTYTTPPTTAQVATAVWQDLTSGGDFGTAGSIGALVKTALPNAAPGAANGLMIAGSNAATTFASWTCTGAMLVSGGTTYTNASGTGFTCSSTGGNGSGQSISGNGAGNSLNIPQSSIGAAIAISSKGGGTNTAPVVQIWVQSNDTSVPAALKFRNDANVAPSVLYSGGLNAVQASVVDHVLNLTTSGAGKDVFHLTPGSGGLGINGVLSEVALCDTLTDYTGNTPQTGDVFSRLGAPVGASVSADIAANKTDIDSILTKLGIPVSSVSADIAALKTDLDAGVILKAAGLDQIVIENGINPRQAMAAILSALAGILSGAATTNVKTQAAGAGNGATNRIDATVDADGNRSAVTLNLPT